MLTLPASFRLGGVTLRRTSTPGNGHAPRLVSGTRDERLPPAAAADQASEPEAPAAAPPPADPGGTDAVAGLAAPAEPATVAEDSSAAAVDRPELRALRAAFERREPVEGRVIGWNNGGFHLAIDDLTAFCPRSEMELGEAKEPETYLDRTFLFRILRIQGKGRRIVVSRAAELRAEKAKRRADIRKRLKPGAVLDGTVASLTDFGAFVDLGGVQGLVHVSEISRSRVAQPADALEVGQQVRVQVLKVEKGGRRISLSMRALEPDPWKDLAQRFPRGAVVKGKVEKATSVGAFIELAPGVTGLLPAKSMTIPRETTPARAYPPGKEVSVQIIAVDPRRQRIALAPEGSSVEGSRADYREYLQRSRDVRGGEGFNAMASAFRRLDREAD